MLRIIAIFCALIFLPCHAELLINDAVLRLLPPGVPNTSAYIELVNTGDKPEVVVSVTTDIARSVEIHNHVMDGETMHMERQEELTVAPGASVKLMPGGLHLMVFGLNQALTGGQAVRFYLTTKTGLVMPFDAIVVRP
ncbi:copper chaperone PCu(A)C [Paraglaciecola sp.]|uniref:copper chaperone PCu(A)C n=1 Tax=Paraglaciecola sp. TaxID=1920173 RepID=UPI0030F4852C